MRSRSELSRRLAAIERAKAATAAQVDEQTAMWRQWWAPWSEMLSDGEVKFLRRLLGRRLPPGVPDSSLAPWPKWQGYYLALCRDGAERAIMEGIYAKVPPPSDPRAAWMAGKLQELLLEWGIMVPLDERELAAEG